MKGFSYVKSFECSTKQGELYGDRTAGFHGYSHLTGGFDGGQAEYARVPFGKPRSAAFCTYKLSLCGLVLGVARADFDFAVVDIFTSHYAFNVCMFNVAVFVSVTHYVCSANCIEQVLRCAAWGYYL